MQKKKRIWVVLACIVILALFINGFGMISDATATKKEIEKIDSLAGMRSDDIVSVDSSEENIETVADPLHGYAVSTANGYATEVGMQILEQGGNAVDAAIAIAYTLSVVQPEACGLGGGGGMLIYDPETDTYSFIDYREISSSNFNTNI